VVTGKALKEGHIRAHRAESGLAGTAAGGAAGRPGKMGQGGGHELKPPVDRRFTVKVQAWGRVHNPPPPGIAFWEAASASAMTVQAGSSLRIINFLPM